MDPIGTATSTSGRAVRPSLLERLALGIRRSLLFKQPSRRRTLDSLSDHLLVDIGLDGPGYEQPMWDRYVHR